MQYLFSPLQLQLGPQKTEPQVPPQWPHAIFRKETKTAMLFFRSESKLSCNEITPSVKAQAVLTASFEEPVAAGVCHWHYRLTRTSDTCFWYLTQKTLQVFTTTLMVTSVTRMGYKYTRPVSSYCSMYPFLALFVFKSWFQLGLAGSFATFWRDAVEIRTRKQHCSQMQALPVGKHLKISMHRRADSLNLSKTMWTRWAYSNSTEMAKFPASETHE